MIQLSNTWTPQEGGYYPKSVLFDLIGYRFYSEEVGRFHASRARVRIPCAPARTSKSYSAAMDCAGDPHGLFPKMERHKGRFFPTPARANDPTKRVWIVAPDYKTNKEFDYLHQLCVENPRTKDLFNVTRRAYSPRTGAMEIVLEWGKSKRGQTIRTVVEGKSATNPESLQGEHIDYCIMSEAAEQEPKIWQRYLSTRCVVCVKPTTPKIKAIDLKNEIDAGESNPELSIESFTFTPHANPFYDWMIYWQEHGKAESRALGKIVTDPGAHDCFSVETDCGAMKDAWFAEQFGGRWTLEADRVLPFRWTSVYGEHCHVLDEMPDWFDYAKLYVAMDYGHLDPSCVHWYAIGIDGTILIYREIYEAKLDPLALAVRIQETTRKYDERVEYYLGDPMKPDLTKFLQELGLPVFQFSSNAKARIRDRASGHMRLVDALSVDPKIGHPRLYVLSEKAGEGFGCPKTIKEWMNLRRKQGVVADQWSPSAIAGNDHAYDTARYLLSSRPSSPDRIGHDAWRETQEHIRHVNHGRLVLSSLGPLTGPNPGMVTYAH